MSPRVGLSVALGALFLLGLVDYVIGKATGIPDEIAPLKKDIGGLPMTLGQWVGKQAEPDPELDEAVGADSIVNRIYSHPDGTVVRLHFGVWHNEDGLPHDPHVCHAGAGYTIRNEKHVPLDGVDDMSALLMDVDRADDHKLVLYWYSMGESLVHTYDQLRTKLWKLRGASSRPPLIKVMLTSEDTRDAETRLRELASAIHHWQHD